MQPTASLEALQPGDIDALLALQAANLKQHLDHETRSSQGFLTFQYTGETIFDMLLDMPQPIAKVQEKVVGYALATSLRACHANPLLQPLATLCQQLEYKNKPLEYRSFYIMGQICISHDHRGQGLFDALYAYHRKLFSQDYDCMVTEICTSNSRSLRAHERVGFQPIHHYHDGHAEWQVVAWDWSTSH